MLHVVMEQERYYKTTKHNNNKSSQKSKKPNHASKVHSESERNVRKPDGRVIGSSASNRCKKSPAPDRGPSARCGRFPARRMVGSCIMENEVESNATAPSPIMFEEDHEKIKFIVYLHRDPRFKPSAAASE